ncbi:hypothetical protein IGI37_001474 [Enterococcus sp. AZ194]|uniref:hypothetical protein n=1 Tax=Enterococcus sp. AZ194 TaxID=2774629 RepID=UPI003F1F1578
MEILIIIEEEKLARSSFLYSKLDQTKTLVQFSPEFSLADETLGAIYEKEGLIGIRQLFEQKFSWHLDGYVRIKLDDLLYAVEKIMPEGLQFEGTVLPVSELKQRLSYQIDEEGNFSVFQQQRALLKSIVKTIGKKQNIFKLPHYLTILSKVSETNLNNGQFLALLKNFASLQDVRSTKVIIPLANTYEVQVKENQRVVKMIDCKSNIDFLQKLTKDS